VRVTVQVWGGPGVGARVLPQVVEVTRKGHSLVMRRMVRGAVA
jgi:hypothetical protein